MRHQAILRKQVMLLPSDYNVIPCARHSHGMESTCFTVSALMVYSATQNRVPEFEMVYHFRFPHSLIIGR